MRKNIWWLVAAVLMMTACGKEASVVETETAATGVEETEAVEIEETSGKAEEQEIEVPEETAEAAPLNVELSAKYEGEWDDKGAIITANSATIHILDDGYRKLKTALDEYNEMNWQEVYTMYLEYREYAKEDIFPDGTELYISREINVTRADSRILSFINAESSFVGGAHGSYYEDTAVYDVATGELLALSDVVNDYDQVYEYVIDSLKEQNEEGMFFAEYEDWVHQMFYEPDGAMTSPLEWNMDMEGITFRFSPYVIAPWAAGKIEVELPFAGNEELFEEEYLVTTERPIIKITLDKEFSVDADGDGQAETYKLSADTNEDRYSTTVTLERHKDEETEMPETCIEEFHGNFKYAYLVTAENGSKYLYMEFLEENDYHKTEIFTLSNLVHTGGVNMATYGHFISDSSQFALYNRIYMLGTYTGYKIYSVGNDGMPETDDEMYQLVNGGTSWEKSITSKRSLKVQMHVEGSDERVEVNIRKGNVFYPRKTDGNTIFEMELEDGRVCDIVAERSEDGLLFMINGVSEYDCFEDLPYAG